MKPPTLTSTDVLGSIEMVATIRIPRHVMWVVRARLWCATAIIRLAGLVGGVSIVVCDDDM